MKHVFLSLALQVLTFSVSAQSIPVNPKFGAVSDAEIDMTSYALDTSAVAVMLYRECQLDLVFNFKLEIVKELTVHERIKVLKEEGKRFADFSFLYVDDKVVKENYGGVKVETFNRENGKIVRTRMSKKYEFDEVYSDGVRRFSFTAENVKVGSVIEVTYKFTSPRYYDIDDLDIQLSIPVNQAKVDVGYAEYFQVNHTQRGYVPTGFRHDTINSFVSIQGGRSIPYLLERDVYTAADVPAMPVEPYSFCPSQYRSTVMYDLSGVAIPGSVYRNFSSTWQDVDKAIKESALVEECRTRFRDRDELLSALEGIEGDEARIVAVRNFVTGKIKWDETSRLVPAPAREILKRGNGSDADINALTASALNTIGYVAEPVLVKRRTSGIMLGFHISLNAFDTFILRVASPDGSQHWFLDAARDHGYLNILNPDLLVDQARLVHGNGTGEWVKLTGICQNRLNEIVRLQKGENGVLAGTVQIRGTGEDSYQIKSHYADFDSEDAYLDEIEEDEGIEITDFSIRKDYGPSVEISYSFEKDVDFQDRVYLRPFLSEFHSTSAFRKEERQIPVDFPYPFTISYSFELAVPDGYVVEELPDNVTLSCPPLQGRLLFQMRQSEGRISGVYRFSLGEVLVVPEAYPDLRAFWEAAIGIERSMIVLKKQ